MSEFYVPGKNEWRSKPDNLKQGSGKPVDASEGVFWTDELEKYIELGERLYGTALERGIAPEQARLFLPANGMYIRYYWTASLQSALHFLDQRLASDAQKEIQDYAKVIEEYVIDKFPTVYKAWLKHKGEIK